MAWIARDGREEQVALLLLAPQNIYTGGLSIMEAKRSLCLKWSHSKESQSRGKADTPRLHSPRNNLVTAETNRSSMLCLKPSLGVSVAGVEAVSSANSTCEVWLWATNQGPLSTQCIVRSLIAATK